MKTVIRSVSSLLTAITLIFLSLSPGWADPMLLYVTCDSAYTAGTFGSVDSIKGTVTATPDRIVNLNGDSKVFTYSHDGSPYVWVANGSSWGTDQDLDQVYVYPLGSYDDGSRIFAGNRGTNVYDLASHNGRVYLANYANLSMSVYQGDDLSRLESLCLDFSTILPKYVPNYVAGYFNAMKIVDGYIYALFMCSDSPSDYYGNDGPGVLLKIDPQDSSVQAYAKVGKNAKHLSHYNGAIYVTCFGGSMGYGNVAPTNETRIDKVNITTDSEEMPVTTFLGKDDITKGVGEHYAFENFMVDDGGTAYFIAYLNDGSWPSVNKLCKIDMAKPSEMQTVYTGPWMNASAMDRERDIMWISCRGTGEGDSYIKGFDLKGDQIASFDGSDLGNMPYSLAIVPISAGGTAPAKTSILSPADGATVSADAVTFKWYSPDGSDGKKYSVHLGTAADELYPVLVNSAKTEIDPGTVNLLSGKTYSWRVDVTANDKTTKGDVFSFKTASEAYVVSPDMGVAFLDDSISTDIVSYDRAELEQKDISIQVASADVPLAGSNETYFRDESRKIEITLSDDTGIYRTPTMEVCLSVDLKTKAPDTYEEIKDEIAGGSGTLVKAVLTRMAFYKQIQGTTYDLAALAKDQDSADYDKYFSVEMKGGILSITTRIVLTNADGGSNVVSTKESGTDRFFLVHCDSKTESGKTVLIDPLWLGIKDTSSDDPSKTGVSGGGCNAVGFSGGTLSLLLPLLILLKKR